MEQAEAQVEAPETPTPTATDLPKKRVLEAALFLANRPMRLDELCAVSQCTPDEAEGLVAELSEEFEQHGSALKITKMEDPQRLVGTEFRMELREEYVPAVSTLSENVELPKKAVRILGLIAKKKKMLQSELKYYFKGDVYDYVDELVRQGFITSKKFKTTKELKPTPKFFEHFQSFQ
ncbi:SMC-Scp complex subunit ScpB [Candidatus Micrarchaeota archaeon]|nr:SMC-Scp complex subunit ScpB [Candidatus Micrarchaeota archaeon]